MPQKTNTKFYTPEEIANMLKLNIGSVWRYIRDKKLNAAKFGRHYRISEEDFNKFIKKHKK